MSNCEELSNGGMTMGLFDVDEEKLQALYHRAWHEAGMGFVDPRKYPYLNKALIQYAREIIAPLIRLGF